MPTRPIVLLLSVLLPCVAAAQEIPWQYERVMPRRDGVRAGRPVAGHLVRVEKKDLSMAGVYTVLRAEGGLLELGNNCGWVARADVMKLADAPAYFTAKIKEEPTVAKWYACRAAAASPDRLVLDLSTTPGQPRVEIGRPADSLNDLREAVRLAPDEPDWRSQLAGQYSAHGELKKAMEQFDEYCRLCPNDAGGYACRASHRLSMGDHKGAVADAERAVELDPHSLPTVAGLAMSYHFTGQTAKATEFFQRVADMPATDAKSYYARAVVRGIVGDLDKMLSDFDEAARLDPLDTNTIMERVGLLHRKGEYYRALADLRRAARLMPRDPLPLRREAFILATCKEDALRDGKRALELARKVIRLSGDNPHEYAWAALAAACAEVGDFPSAVAAQKRAMQALDGKGNYYDEITTFRWWLNQYERDQPRRE